MKFQTLYGILTFGVVYLKNKDENGHYVNLPDCTTILMIKTATRNCIVAINGRGGGTTETYVRMTIMLSAETSVRKCCLFKYFNNN